jgi:hypothetical protein
MPEEARLRTGASKLSDHITRKRYTIALNDDSESSFLTGK